MKNIFCFFAASLASTISLLDRNGRFNPCNTGMKFNTQAGVCEDLNECESAENPCQQSQICVNTPGSYKCLWNMSRSGSVCLQNYYKTDNCCAIDTTESATCGTQIPTYKRIYGGNRTSINNWPWMAALYLCKNNRCKLCGGSFISDDWIVTAGHCVDYFHPSHSTVFAGATEFDQTQAAVGEDYQPVRYEIVSFEIHPGYQSTSNNPANDIAIVRVQPKDRIDQSSFAIKPICLPSGEMSSPGKNCWVAGYGKLNFDDQMPDLKLSEAHVPISADDDCAKEYSQLTPQSMICAGHAGGGSDACTNDSGGPLICQRCESCSFYLAGIVSFGRNCGQTYGVYTRVSYFESWIRAKTAVRQTTTKTCPNVEICESSCKSFIFEDFHFFPTTHSSSTGQTIYKNDKSEQYLVPVIDRSGRGFSGWVISELPNFTWETSFSHFITAQGFRNELKCPNHNSYTIYDRQSTPIGQSLTCSELAAPMVTPSPVPEEINDESCCSQVALSGLSTWTRNNPLLLNSVVSTSSEINSPHQDGIGKYTTYFSQQHQMWIVGESFDINKSLCYVRSASKCLSDVKSGFHCLLSRQWQATSLTAECSSGNSKPTTSKPTTTRSTTTTTKTTTTTSTGCCAQIKIDNHGLALPDPYLVKSDGSNERFKAAGSKPQTLMKMNGLVVFGVNYDFSESLCYASAASIKCLNEAISFSCLAGGSWRKQNKMTLRCVANDIEKLEVEEPETESEQDSNVNSLGCRAPLTVANHGISSIATSVVLSQDTFREGDKHFYSQGNMKSTIYFDKTYQIWIFGEEYDIKRAHCYSTDKVSCPQEIKSFKCFKNGEWIANNELSIE